MEEKKNNTCYKEVLNSEMNDIWDIFFPYMADNEEEERKPSITLIKEKRQPRSYMKFLTM